MTKASKAKEASKEPQRRSVRLSLLVKPPGPKPVAQKAKRAAPKKAAKGKKPNPAENGDTKGEAPSAETGDAK